MGDNSTRSNKITPSNKSEIPKSNLPIDRKLFEDYLSFELPGLIWNEKCYQCLLYLSTFPENGSGLTEYHEKVVLSLSQMLTDKDLNELNHKIAGVRLKALAYVAAGGPSFLSGLSAFLGNFVFAACFLGLPHFIRL
jgi:hypothetical protein